MYKRVTIAAVFLISLTGISLSQTTHFIYLHRDMEGNFSFSTGENTIVIDNSTNENFTIEVDEGDTIIWEGMTSQGGAKIDIDKVRRREGTNIFRWRSINGNRGEDGKRRVDAKVKSERAGVLYKYDLEFSIGDETFVIDPKIKVRG